MAERRNWLQPHLGKMMVAESEFAATVLNAYQHLYDLVSLRTHPLTELLGLDASSGSRDRAWELHHQLLDAIEELDPGPQAPMYSHEWSRYRLMRLRYVDGLEPLAIAGKIAVSRSQYYREHDAAIASIAELLWQRVAVSQDRTSASQEPTGAPEEAAPQPALSRLELLRLEAGRLAQTERHTHLDDVAQGVLAILEEMLRERDLSVHLQWPASLPGIAVDRGLLRQMLLAAIGRLAEHAAQGAVRLKAQVGEGTVRLAVTIEPATAVEPLSPAQAEEWTFALAELGSVSDVQVSAVSVEGRFTGFALQLPLGPQRPVLVVDDNEDVRELLQRYLHLHGYRTVMAQTAQDAIELAQQTRPFAITLDLMMPDQDGWDVLQMLLRQPATRNVPIIVCSVLREKNLALSLGATAFLEKPIKEQALVSILETLHDGG